MGPVQLILLLTKQSERKTIQEAPKLISLTQWKSRKKKVKRDFPQ